MRSRSGVSPRGSDPDPVFLLWRVGSGHSELGSGALNPDPEPVSLNPDPQLFSALVFSHNIAQIQAEYK